MKLKHRALFIRNAGGTFTPIDVFSGDGQGGSGTSDHSQLINRTAADSHPMSAITGLVAALAAKFVKPETGIPKSDLASAVQTSLGLADSAVQPEAGKGLFSGSYNDLTDKPTIPSGETDPVFSASVAAWITSENISAWNGKQDAKIVTTAVLPLTVDNGGTVEAAWYNKSQTINVTGVTASNTVQISAADKASADAWAECGVWCRSQGAGTLTFSCETVPVFALALNILIWN